MMEIMVSKQPKLINGKSCLDQGEDRISKLPDVLLHHILYFVPTKCAVCTSILSKRWRYVWVSVPSLDLCEWRSSTTKDINSETKSFVNFMDRMLIRRDMSSICKFSLSLDKHCDEFPIDEWISAVIKRKVEEVGVFGKVHFPIPVSLFTCESLTLLEIKSTSDLNLPESVCLPRLKILRLTVINFTDEYLTEQLFSSCPMLEDLSIRCCSSSMGMGVLSISAPALKYLVIDFFYGIIKINAPSLVSFKHSGNVANEYVLCSFSSLVDADIRYRNACNWERKQEIGFNATKLVGGLSNVKRLIVSGDTLLALSFAGDLLTSLPTFHNLIHFEVSSQFFYTSAGGLFDLLRISPNIETLIFSQGIDPCNDEVWTSLYKVPLCLLSHLKSPQCLLPHLKSVEFREFDGQPREMDIVKLILMKAGVLQRMTISISSRLSKSPKEKWFVKHQLLATPTGSTSCAFKFL